MGEEIDYCEVCGQELCGGSHYHCGRCESPEETTMYGHYVRFSDGTEGFTCDPANAGKALRRG